MANENKIILEFPASSIEIELGTTITFDNISGYLDTDRLTGNFPMERIEGNLPVNRLEDISGVMSEQDGHDIWSNS